MPKIGEVLAGEWRKEQFASELSSILDTVVDAPEAAVEQLKVLAAQGSCLAMYYISDILSWGRGGHERNFADAICWAERAAQCGSIEGGFLHASLLEGEGRFEEANQQYQSLVDLSHAPSMYRLAISQMDPVGAGSDTSRASDLFSKASAQGHMPSRAALAYLKRKNGKNVFESFSGVLDALKLTPKYVYHYLYFSNSDNMRR